MIRRWVYDFTTRMVADTIAFFSPAKAAEYRASRAIYWRAYNAAKLGGPYQLSNRPSYASGQSEVEAARRRVTSKVRDLSRNNPIVSAMKLKRTTMVVGDEIGIKAHILKADGKPNKDLNKQIEKKFYQWAESAEIGGWSLTEAFYMVENHLFDDGEVLLKVVRDKKATGNKLRIQVLETDYLDAMKGQQGVEYDQYGRPVAFWIHDKHPGDAISESRRYSADDIYLIAETERSSQRRDISPLASAVFKLFGVDDLEDAELVSSRSAAAYSVFIESPLPTWNEYTGSDGNTTAPEDDNGAPLEYMQSGAVVKLGPGEKISSFKSERPNSNFDSFIRSRFRNTAGVAGLSYETATGDYSQVNYSSARMGRIIEWACIQRRQKRLIKYLNIIYREWLREEILMRSFTGFPIAEYNQDPKTYSDCSWQLAGNHGIDPVKEANATEKNIQLGLTSRQRQAAERGDDFTEIAREQAEEKQLMQELGIWGDDPTASKAVSSTPEMEAVVDQPEQPKEQEAANNAETEDTEE